MRYEKSLLVVVVAVAAVAGSKATAETRGAVGVTTPGFCSMPASDQSPAPARAARERYDAGSGVRFWAGMDSEGRAVLRLTAARFEFEKSVTASGQTSIRIVGGDDRVTVTFAQHVVSVGRGKARVRFDPRLATEEDENKVRRLLVGSRAVRIFRAIAAHLESRSPEEDDFFATSTLVDGALVGLLDGDNAGVGRVARRIGKRQRARLQSVAAGRQSRYADCVGLYESTVGWAWNEYQGCVGDAEDDGLLMRSINTNFCTAEWILRAEGAAFQFISCSALPT
jgi:hypothetical protein